MNLLNNLLLTDEEIKEKNLYTFLGSCLEQLQNLGEEKIQEILSSIEEEK